MTNRWEEFGVLGGPDDDDHLDNPLPRRASECPAGGPHNYEFLSAGDQQDDSGQRFYDRWACAECGASASRSSI